MLSQIDLPINSPGFKGVDKVFKVIDSSCHCLLVFLHDYQSRVSRKRFGLSCNMKKILDNSPRAQGMEAIPQPVHANWNNPLIPPCLWRPGSGGNFLRLMR